MHLEISDLPPSMQRQAIKKLLTMEKKSVRTAAEQEAKKRDGGTASKDEFDSNGEREFYFYTVLPGIRKGEIKECIKHPVFELFKKSDYCGMKLSAIRYTPDFLLKMSDGSTEVIEIKSKFVRRMQRDYHIRRRLFIELVARPNNYIFREIITGEAEKRQKS